MTKTYCDRCKLEIPPRKHVGGGHFHDFGTKLTFSREHTYAHYTLCNGCEEDAHSFLKGER